MTDPESDDEAAETRIFEEVDVATLLGEAHETFEEVLGDETAVPLAVTSSPFAGREVVLDDASERLDATRVRLDPTDDLATDDDRLDGVADALDTGPVVVDDCQHLYHRTVGGFETIEAFLDLLARADVPVVTGWNRYAWRYLTAVRGLDRAFQHRFDVGPVATDRLGELLLSRYEEGPTFVSESTETGRPVTIQRREVGWGDHTVSVPVPSVTRPRGRRSPDETIDTRDVVFERLAAVSQGNLGVASSLWEPLHGGEVRPSDVVAAGSDVDLDREEAFCLRIVLSKERVARRELAAVLDASPDRILDRLDREGLVTVREGLVHLDPAAVPTITDATEERRIQ